MAAWNPAPPAKPQKSVSSGFAGGLPGTPEQMGFDVQDGPEPLRYVGELFKTYILAERGDEICIIDKHAAHERQLFEKLAADYGDVPSQLLLEPVVVELSAEEKTALLNNLPAATACSSALSLLTWSRAMRKTCWWNWPQSLPEAAVMH